jgi:hypothetical protein
MGEVITIHDADREKYLKEVTSLDFFQGEIALENDLILRWTQKLVSLQLTDGQLALEYAELRGRILAIQELQNTRKRITSAATSALKREK